MVNLIHRALAIYNHSNAEGKLQMAKQMCTAIVHRAFALHTATRTSYSSDLTYRHSSGSRHGTESARHSASDPSCPPCGAFRRPTARTLHPTSCHHSLANRVAPSHGHTHTLFIGSNITTQLKLATWHGVGSPLCIRSMVPSVWRLSTANGTHSASDPSCLHSLACRVAPSHGHPRTVTRYSSDLT